MATFEYNFSKSKQIEMTKVLDQLEKSITTSRESHEKFVSHKNIKGWMNEDQVISLSFACSELTMMHNQEMRRRENNLNMYSLFEN